MAIITKEDLKIMIDVEDLLHDKLQRTNGVKDIWEDGTIHYYFPEGDKEYDIWLQYWNMIERFLQDKKVANKKANRYNKKHAEYHRLMNNLCNARKNKDKERIAYYTLKLKELKEREGR